MAGFFKTSKTGKNAAAIYAAFFSNSVCAIFSIPLAVHFLSKPQIGLWTVINQVIAYLLWLDLGMGDGLGRTIAPAIANNDQMEASRWWSLSLVVLLGQALLLLLIAACSLPLFLWGLAVPQPLVADASWLFLGSAVIAALALPSRIYPGILLAQERFHWVPLFQSLFPWLQLGSFWLLLRAGFGIRSYLISLLFAQMIPWAGYVWLVHFASPQRFFFQRDGLKWGRFKELFGYSSSIAVTGIVNSILGSLPALILGRAGGLGSIPPYGFTQRLPGLLGNLSSRTTLAFYPSLQRLYVSGQQDEFLSRYRRVLDLTLATGLIGAAAVIACNRVFLEWVAGAEFFAGSWANLWFATGVLIGPLTACWVHLLQYSGSMGRIALVSVSQIIAGVLMTWLAFHWFGLAGVAAAMSLLPLVTLAPYALWRGARNCGVSPVSLLGSAGLRVPWVVLLIAAAGAVVAWVPAQPVTIVVLGTPRSLPTWIELAAASVVAVIGASHGWRAFRQMHAG